MNVFETQDVYEYLYKRNLINQYKKAKKYMLEGYYKQVDFKLREPKKDKIYYFRINKQFRAFGKMNATGDLIIGEISNHQEK